MDYLKIRRAVLSVSDKEGLLALAKFLHSQGVELFASGGTAQKLEEAKIPVTPMEKITKNPEAFGGRMKTISFPFASALLYRRENSDDCKMAAKMGIEPMDLVVCNLYPFMEARKKGLPDAELIEEIDVGGPTMIRAAGKNHASVAVVTNPKQYESLMEEMVQNQGALSLQKRKVLAVEAFKLLSRYDGAVAEELSKRYTEEEILVSQYDHGMKLRYGENPTQGAVLYRDPNFPAGTSLVSGNVLQGKALSYNNILDADAAWRVCSDMAAISSEKDHVVAIIKHLNPCGLAKAQNVMDALQLAWAGDPISAFGGILAFNSTVTLNVAEWLADKFVEVIIAPSIEPEAAKVFAAKKNLRVLLCPLKKPDAQERMIRSVHGGVLVQEEDQGISTELKVVTTRKIPEELGSLMAFGQVACKHLRSNAIAIVREVSKGKFQLAGAGMGQPNRVDSLKVLAGPRAAPKGPLSEMVMISDAFFPFSDTVEAAHEMGIRYIVQPGGSLKDSDVIKKADELGIAMAFTGRRHFRH